MINVIITFEVKKDSLEEVKRIIRKFVSSVASLEENTLMYKSYQHCDAPERFTHVMCFSDVQARDVHRRSTHCEKFVEKLYPLCTEPPAPVEVKEIKSE